MGGGRRRWRGYALLAAPGAAFADGHDLSEAIAGKLPEAVGINTIWVIVAGSW